MTVVKTKYPSVSNSPSLLSEWNYEKNAALDPSSISQGSGRKVWWKCSKSHEWSAVISTRTHGSRCPFCSGALASPESNLEVEFPLVAAQWHPTKNNGKLPSQFRPKSSKKAWWLCSRGHEWESVISARTAGSGCPKCKPSTSKAEIRVYSEMKALFDDAEWRADFNGKEIDIYVPSINLAIEIDGYLWHKDKHESDLNKNKFFEFHGLTVVRLRDEKLKKLGGNEFRFNSSSLDEDVWFSFVRWLVDSKVLDESTSLMLRSYVDKGQLINDELARIIISRLPSPLKEKSIETLYPELMKEWDHEANLPFLPDMFTAGSHEKVWWRCSHDHSWKAVISTRVAGNGCNYCGKGEGKRRLASNTYNLALANPKLASEWSDKNKLLPTEVSPNASKKVWWKCAKGHEWEAVISSRNNGRDCPICNSRTLGVDNSLAATMPELAKDWDYEKNDLKPEEVMQRSGYKAWWKCSTCGHGWQTNVYARAQGKGCIKCSYKNGSRKRKALPKTL